MKKEKTLLEKAKEVKTLRKRSEPNKELIDLCVAWANDEITITQVMEVLSLNGSSCYARLAIGLKVYIKNIKNK